MKVRAILAALVLVVATSRFVTAQTPPSSSNEQLRVYIDCSHQCDETFLKTEVNWVSYMRDRADAQVHVLVTSQSTGGGGQRFTFNFIGLKEFQGVNDTLSLTVSSDDSDDVRRRAMTKTIALGLVPFAARTPLGQKLAVGIAPARGSGGPPRAGAAAMPEHDPWNFWTFRIGMNGFGNGESQSNQYNLNGNLSASRVTEAWKVNLSAYARYSENKYEYTINGVDYKTKSITKNYSFNTLTAKSLGPHLSAGLEANANTSTYGNTSLGVSIQPAVEYNFLPYSESTRRSFLVRYSAGARYADYRHETIYGEVEETRPLHQLEIEYNTTQPWGRVYLSLNGSQYLHDTQKYNAGIGGNTEIRLFKGFSFNIGGNYARIRDQLSLSAKDLTQEEVLLQQRQLATSYQYFANFGISYRFGSIFNSIVNPRFGGGGGGMVIMYQ